MSFTRPANITERAAFAVSVAAAPPAVFVPERDAVVPDLDVDVGVGAEPGAVGKPAYSCAD